jgi:HAD superfamily hydrolase (TIGR01544 family)
MTNYIITNLEKLKSLSNNLHQSYFVFDFDGTLTQRTDKHGKVRPSIISLLRDEWVLDKDYVQKAHEMYDRYSKIEHDQSLSRDVRFASMNERWITHKELLMAKWLTKSQVDTVVAWWQMVMRPGTDELLRQAHTHNIPVIIFSASGIGTNAIQPLLQQWWLGLDNIHIVSNELYRDDNWVMIGYNTPSIHSLNKTEATIYDDPQYAHIHTIIANKTYALVMWDGLWDASMVADAEWRVVYRVGLCNDKVDERLATYQAAFDMVITNDDSLHELNNLLFNT